MKRILTTLLLGTSALGLVSAAQAQEDYPSQPITIVVPAAAGGPSDTVARLVADAMGKELGQNIIIENMGGAGGSLGAGRVAGAEPDGYTLLLYHIGVSTFAALYPDLPYQPIEAFDSVGLITEVPMMLVGRKDLEPENVDALFDYLKGDGAGATFGTAGIGAVSDLCGRLLVDATGVELTVVPYPGTGPAMTDLVGGQIDLMCDQSTNTVSQIEGGEIKPYAVTLPERIEVLPDVLTLDESGYEGFNISAWHAIWAPAGTPEEIRTKLAEALQVALTDETLIERFASLGTAPVSAEEATPEAMQAHFESEVARWEKLLAAE